MKLTIVIACKNSAQTVDRTLESVARQTFPDFEAIVIDGASQDGTLDVLSKYRKIISKMISEPDEGVFQAQNKGARLADGDYLYFLNAGDALADEVTLERIFARKPNEDFFYGDLFVESRLGIIRKPTPKKLGKAFLYADSVPCQASFIKRELFERLGGFDVSFKFAADYDFFLKAVFVASTSYNYYKIPVAYYNLDGITADPMNRKSFFRERALVRERFYTKSERSALKVFGPAVVSVRKTAPYAFFFIKSKFAKK